MKLSQRIVLMASGALLTLSAGFLITQEIKSQRLEQRSADTAISATQALWQNVAKVERGKMLTAVRGMTRNRDALSALAAENFVDLKDELDPTANRLSASGVATQIIVVTPAGRPVYPEVTAENVQTSDPLIEISLKSKKVLSGLTIRNGRPSFAIATPLYKGRDFIGIALLVNSLKVAAEQIKESAGSDVLILGNDKQLVLTTDNALLLQKAESSYLQDTPKHFQMVAAEKTLRGIVLPLRDAEKSNIGYLVTLSDITEFAAAERNFSRLAYGALALIVVISLLALNVFLRRSFKPLDRVTVTIKRLSDGETDIKMENYERRDEIGSIWQSIAVFKENMAETARLQARQREAEQREQEKEKQRTEAARQLAEKEAREKERVAEEERQRTEEMEKNHYEFRPRNLHDVGNGDLGSNPDAIIRRSDVADR